MKINKTEAKGKIRQTTGIIIEQEARDNCKSDAHKQLKNLSINTNFTANVKMVYFFYILTLHFLDELS